MKVKVIVMKLFNHSGGCEEDKWITIGFDE